MASYFKKILLSTPVHLGNGQKVVWTALVGNEGVLATEDTAMESALRAAITKGVGGISEIDEAEYERLKKNPASRLKKPQWQPGVMPAQIDPFRGSKPSPDQNVAEASPAPVVEESAREKPAARKTSVRKNVFKKTDE